MSLEDAITELTAAVKANTAALKAGGKSAADTLIDETAAKKVQKETAGRKPATKKITLDTIKEEFGGYLGIENKAERKKRIEQVQAIVDHFGVDRASALAEEDWAAALGYLKQFKDGDTPDFMNEDAGEEGDDGALV